MTAFLTELEHPRKAEIEAVRELILQVDPEIREDIKWNAPSFYTDEHFATFNLRSRGGEQHVLLILHGGAKPKEMPITEEDIGDPAGMLEWLAPDRCCITFTDEAAVRSLGPGLQDIVRQWIGRR